MTISKRLLVLATLVAALAVPVAALADNGGGSAPTTAAGARPVRAVRVIDRLGRRLDRRFQVFSKHCLVQNAPERCTTAADRFATRLGKAQTHLQKLEAKLKETCGAANPPKRCTNLAQVTEAIDGLLARISSDVSAIKASFPNAGS